MKNLIFAWLALNMFWLIACSSGKKPKEIAIAFSEAMAKQDYETAKKYATEDSQKFIDLMKGMAGEKKQDKAPKYVVVSETISGETATVKIKDTANNNTENEIYLKKVEGKWLINTKQR